MAVVVAALLAVACSTPPADVTAKPVAVGGAEPTLGKVWAGNQKGYGDVRPTTIDNGGDPTGVVEDVTWQSWGQDRAEGTGTSDYVGSAPTVAQGTEETAHVTAFDLGMCDGKLMYQAIEWYFPQHGESFDPNSYINICTGDHVGTR